MHATDWIQRYFDADSAPDARTVRGWVQQGLIPGRMIGRSAYIDAEAFEQSTGNVLADKVLQKLAAGRTGVQLAPHGLRAKRGAAAAPRPTVRRKSK